MASDHYHAVKKLLIILLLIFPVSALADDVSLEWTASDTPEVVGYRVGIGLEPGVYTEFRDAGNVTAYTVKEVAIREQILYFAVVAYAADGSESEPSNEVNSLVLFTPEPPPMVDEPEPPEDEGDISEEPPAVSESCPGGTFSYYSSGTGGGWVSVTPSCPNKYAEGQTVSVKAVPNNSTVRFDSWSGDLAGSENPTSYTFGPKTAPNFKATFVPVEQTPASLPAPANFRIVVR